MSEELKYTAFQSRYRDKQYIGAGGFGKVYKVFDHAKNHYVALKVSDVRPEWNKFTLKKEVELVNKLNYHRNIARYDACYRFNTGITGEMDFALLKFYEDGNLEQFLKRNELSQEDKRLIIGGILNGLAFLHDNNIIHRDLKAENILLSREDGVWTPKITDFGLSREVDQSTNITNSAVGISYAYAAPEQILNQKIYRNVDIWAVGVIIYRIIANELPFANQNKENKKSVNTQLEISKKITSNQLPEKLETLEEPFRSIIKRCLVNDPLERAQTPGELILLLKGDQGADQVNKVKPELHATPPAEELLDDDHEKTVFSPRPSEKPDQLFSIDAKESSQLPPEYEMPNQNQTQFFPQPVAREKSESDPKKESSKKASHTNGDRKSKFPAGTIFAILILLGVAVGLSYWFLSESNQAKSKKSTDKEVAFIPNEAGNSENQAFQEYSELEKTILQSREDGAKLAELERELSDLAKTPANSDNYRPYYLLALTRAINNSSPRSIFSTLRESATIAANNDSAGKLIADMQESKNGAFRKASMIGNGRRWNEIIQELEQYK